MSCSPYTIPRTVSGLLAACLILAVSAAQAGTIYVLSNEAPLLQAPSFNAQALGQAARGDSLTLVQEQGSWLEVEHEATTAWVSRWLVGPNPPQDKVSVLTDDAPTGEVRRRASSVTTAGAIRGLSEGETELGGAAADYAELAYLESLRPTPSALAAFAQPLTETPK